MASLKKAYQLLALIAIAHLFALGGGLGYLVATGKLDSVRAAELVEVFRDVDESEETPVEDSSEKPVAASGQSVESIEQQQIEEEMTWRSSVRHQAELDQRQQAMQLEMLSMERKREQFERYRQQIIEQQDARKDVDQSRGFKKELELFSQMKAKQALGFLLAKKPEDAAHLLLEMPGRSAKKIVESAKTPEERQAVTAILSLMGEVAPQELTDAVP
ncbi:MAG: hypothetical protein IID37_04830 [Planctomycetes bacterium]|nr:hypothetical protein [Planctomycetota bacterium]